MEGEGGLGAMPVLPRDRIEALKAAKDRLRETLQSEVQTLEEALHTEYNKFEAAFEGLAVEAARQAEHAVNEDARLASLHQLECDNLAAERAKLDAEKAAMEGLQQFQSSRIKLNVGGTRFETSRGTLCMVPESMLAAMFSGRHALTPDEDGSYFIDRYGQHFGHILNFLRQGTIQVELNTDTARALAIEPEFYGLADLASVLRTDGLDITRYLGEEIASMRAREMQLREPLSIPKLPGRRDPSAPINNHEGLLSVFEDEGVVEQMNDLAKDPMGFFERTSGHRSVTTFSTRSKPCFKMSRSRSHGGWRGSPGAHGQHRVWSQVGPGVSQRFWFWTSDREN